MSPTGVVTSLSGFPGGCLRSIDLPPADRRRRPRRLPLPRIRHEPSSPLRSAGPSAGGASPSPGRIVVGRRRIDVSGRRVARRSGRRRPRRGIVVRGGPGSTDLGVVPPGRRLGLEEARSAPSPGPRCRRYRLPPRVRPGPDQDQTSLGWSGRVESRRWVSSPPPERCALSPAFRRGDRGRGRLAPSATAGSIAGSAPASRPSRPRARQAAAPRLAGSLGAAPDALPSGGLRRLSAGVEADLPGVLRIAFGKPEARRPRQRLGPSLRGSEPFARRSQRRSAGLRRGRLR